MLNERHRNRIYKNKIDEPQKKRFERSGYFNGIQDNIIDLQIILGNLFTFYRIANKPFECFLTIIANHTFGK